MGPTSVQYERRWYERDFGRGSIYAWFPASAFRSGGERDGKAGRGAIGMV